jgi:hypothetical protein
VDKIQFNTVLKRFTATTKREAEDILSLKSQYPYSQLLTALAARVTKDHNFTVQNSELTVAAVYAADRTVLKEVMTYAPVEEIIAPREEAEIIPAEKDDAVDRSSLLEKEGQKKADEKSEMQLSDMTVSSPLEAKEEKEKEKEKEKFTKEKPIITLAPPIEKIVRYDMDSDDVAGEVMKDLYKLSQLKQNFEMLLTDYADTANRSEKVTAKAKDLAETTAKKDPVKIDRVEKETELVKDAPKTEAKESLKVRRQRMIAHAKMLQEKEMLENETPAVARPPKHPPQDEIIDDIKKNNAEITPESEKQQQQINVINHFIKTQPSISNAKDRTIQTSGDLSAIKTGEFGDNIISETLVEILLKQGKKDKAIEVLKKLIWKYPQKKAYFASQIEELKK